MKTPITLYASKPEKKDYTVRICLIITLYMILFVLYSCLTFPVLGWHGPACICDECLDRLDAEPARVQYLDELGRK